MLRRILLSSMVAVVLVALVCACSGEEARKGSSGVKEKDKAAAGAPGDQARAAGSQGPPEAVAATAAGFPEGPSPGLPVTPVADLEAIRANLVDPVTASLPANNSVEPVSPVRTEITLSHMIDQVWGIRLPASAPGLALEARIGLPPYSLSFLGDVDTDLPDLFPRELVVVVSKEEMIVNDVKVADVITRETEDGEGQTWEVPKSEGTFRIRALTAQLQQYTGFRSTLLRAAGLAPELADACDVATLIIDGDLPYRFLAEVVLSAGHADIFRFRLATRSTDGLISYQVITAPRLDTRMVEATNLVGDAWWREAPPQARDFEFAYVNYIASRSTDDWRGEEGQDLGICLDPEILTWDQLVDRRQRKEMEATLKEILARSRRSAEAAAAEDDREVQGTVDEPEPGAPPEGGVPEIGVPKETAAAGTKPGAPGSEEDGAAVPPPGTLVVAPLDEGEKVPFIYLRQDGAYLVQYDMERLEAVRSELYGPEKLDLMVSTLKETHPGPGVLHLGADLEVPVSRLVEVADLLRYRCRIQSMSGRCIERERWLASVVLFASLPGRFGLMPEPPPVPLDPSSPYHPAMSGDEAQADPGICPLKEIQGAAAPCLKGLRACLGTLEPGQDVNLSLRWHPAGRFELLATEPPLPEERVRCLKAAMSAPVPGRDTGCDAALLLKAAPAPAG